MQVLVLFKTTDCQFIFTSHFLHFLLHVSKESGSLPQHLIVQIQHTAFFSLSKEYWADQPSQSAGVSWEYGHDEHQQERAIYLVQVVCVQLVWIREAHYNHAININVNYTTKKARSTIKGHLGSLIESIQLRYPWYLTYG